MRAVLLIILSVLLRPVAAQVGELGFTGGVSYYIGDINPYRHYPRHTSLAGGITYRLNFNDRYSLRLQAIAGRLEAYDADSPDTLQQQRNLGFRSRLFEASAVVEVNFLKYRALKDGTAWTPFLFVGIGYYHFNPMAELDGRWYELRGLGTEGQGTSVGGERYSTGQISIPFGGGFKFALTRRLDLQLEWGTRRTYTDYLDDVSGRYADQATLLEEAGPLTAYFADPGVHAGTNVNRGRARGDADNRDWYHYTAIGFSYRLTRWTECKAMWDSKRRGTQR